MPEDHDDRLTVRAERRLDEESGFVQPKTVHRRFVGTHSKLSSMDYLGKRRPLKDAS